MEILRVENLSFSYPGKAENAVDNVSFDIENGDFVVVCGESGCGKTTLLRLLKRELAPFGSKSGKIMFNGTEQTVLSDRTSAFDIGFVFQNPFNQIVTDKVWHELAFGLENMGMPSPVIKRRVSETASYFGINDWFLKDTSTLSGGQAQLLNLAAIMLMRPKLLLLDEPTAQLDPISASEFFTQLKKLNYELGITVILVEHRLEEVFPVADKVLLMEHGKVLLLDKPEAVIKQLKAIDLDHKMFDAFPCSVRIFNAFDIDTPCPVTVRDGQKFLQNNFSGTTRTLSKEKPKISGKTVLALKDVWFRYEKEEPDVLKGIDLEIKSGEIFCIMGGNATGKTTLLNVMSGIRKPYRGKVTINDKKLDEYKGNMLYRRNLTVLPQNPQTLFLKSTVEEDLSEFRSEHESDADYRCEFEALCGLLDIEKLLKMHPYDLSGGEQQRVAMAKLLLLKPKILLLDEPVKGLDAHAKLEFQQILKMLQKDGMTLVIVTHDLDFAAGAADRCAMFFNGEITCIDSPVDFFLNNDFYTTAANRISRELYDDAVLCEDVVELCKRNGVLRK